MNELLLFTDGSVNTLSKVGYGAYLFISKYDLPLDSIKKLLRTKRFKNTSSSKLELQTLLWALGDIQTNEYKVIIYTDSQNIIGLPTRRERFEKTNYRTKKNNLIANHELYQEFYKITDQINYEIVKVRGHQVSDQKNQIDKFFTLVDRASRKALRKDNR